MVLRLVQCHQCTLQFSEKAFHAEHTQCAHLVPWRTVMCAALFFKATYPKIIARVGGSVTDGYYQQTKGLYMSRGTSGRIEVATATRAATQGCGQVATGGSQGGQVGRSSKVQNVVVKVNNTVVKEGAVMKQAILASRQEVGSLCKNLVFCCCLPHATEELVSSALEQGCRIYWDAC